MSLFQSDEDTDIRALVKSWLKKNAPDNKSLEGWIEDYFHKAVDLVINQLELVVPTTLVGVVLAGLSHLGGVSSRGEFACAIIRGLGGNLNESSKEALAKEVGNSFSFDTGKFGIILFKSTQSLSGSSSLDMIY